MKAMVLNGPNLPFERVQRPDPVAGPGEAVARVITCGAGLTIQHVKAGRRKVQFPRIIGHEITGEIVEAGPGVSGLKVGDAGDHLFLSELRPLPLVPDQTSSRYARTAAVRSGWNATAPMPSTSSCRRRTSSSCRRGSITRSIPPRSASSPTRWRRPTRCCAARA